MYPVNNERFTLNGRIGVLLSHLLQCRTELRHHVTVSAERGRRIERGRGEGQSAGRLRPHRSPAAPLTLLRVRRRRILVVAELRRF